MRLDTINAVFIGGGTGMPIVLTGMKENPWIKPTAIVAVTDDGGSSGELSDTHGILPMGDILDCYMALSPDNPELRNFFTYRADIHTMGNLHIKTLFEQYGIIPGLKHFGQALGVVDRVLPVSTNMTTLCAEFSSGQIIKGETAIDIVMRERFQIKRLFLDPQVDGCEKAIKAIKRADAICIGPGSTFTSVLPNFLPTGITQAIAKSKAPIIFVCNLMTEGWGMNDFTVSKTVALVESYVGRKMDKFIANNKLPNGTILGRYRGERKMPMKIDRKNIDLSRLVEADLWIDETEARHDPKLLSYLVQSVIFNCLQ